MFKELSDSGLILYCADNGDDRQALEEFFKRFNPYFDKRISVMLKSGEIYDEDPKFDVKYEFIKKIKNGLLLQAVEKENPKAWLGRAVANLAIDRRRKNNQLCDAYKHLGEKEALSLSEHRSHEDRRVREDFIIDPDDGKQLEKIKEKTGILFNKIEELGENYRLTIKTAIMLYEPLDEEVIRKIADKRKKPYETIVQEVNQIRKDLVERYNENLALQHRAANLWSRINKLKQQHFILLQNKESYQKRISLLQNEINSINRPQNNPAEKKRQIIESYKKQIAAMQEDIEKVEDLEKEIKKKEENRENNLKRCRNSIRPTARQISRLLAISEENANYINTLLKRTREILHEHLNDRKGGCR